MRFVLPPRKELFLGIRIIGISLEESESELLLPTPWSLNPNLTPGGHLVWG